MKRVPPHSYLHPAAGGFVSAYEPSDAAGLTGIWSFGEAFTFCASPGGPVDGLDQIWATSAPLELVARRALFNSEAHRTKILAGGLPNAVEPSDHLPIGAVYKWRAGERPDLKEALAAAAAAAAAADRPAMPTTVAELEAEMNSLLASCPFKTDDDRAAYTALMSLPDLGLKGKPTPEQQAELEDRRTRKAALTKGLSNEGMQMLKRVSTLAKAAKKANQAKEKKKSPKMVRAKAGAAQPAVAAAPDPETGGQNADTAESEAKVAASTVAVGGGSDGALAPNVTTEAAFPE